MTVLIAQSDDLQLVAVLPDVVETDDVWVVQQLHNTYLSLQAKWDDLAVRVQRRVFLGALDKIGQAQCSYFLRGRLRYDLRSGKLPSTRVSNEPYARASASTNSPAQLPWADVCLASPVGVGRVGAGIGDF
jgi:hypothetical protein